MQLAAALTAGRLRWFHACANGRAGCQQAEVVYARWDGCIMLHQAAHYICNTGPGDQSSFPGQGYNNVFMRSHGAPTFSSAGSVGHVEQGGIYRSPPCSASQACSVQIAASLKGLAGDLSGPAVALEGLRSAPEWDWDQGLP